MMPFLGWHDQAATDLRRLGAHLELGILPDLLGPADHDQPGTARPLPPRTAGLRRRPGTRALPHARRGRPALAARTGETHRRRRRALDHDRQRTKAAREMTIITLLPGDGVGCEILDGPITFLHRLAADGLPITLTGPMPFGTTGWQQTGEVLPEQTIEACRAGRRHPRRRGRHPPRGDVRAVPAPGVRPDPAAAPVRPADQRAHRLGPRQR